MPSSTEDFFEEPLEHSRIKARIVSDYVISFARILSDHLKSVRKLSAVAYIDLFSGPGSYEDGTASTPLLILRAAVKDPKLMSSLQTYFNDSNPGAAATLKRELESLSGLEKLAHKPIVLSSVASVELVHGLQLKPQTPKLFFLDPFGYKALTMPLLRTVLNGWAECVFFFNYRRVIAAISNPVLESHVAGLFGRNRLEAMRQELRQTSGVKAREKIVLIRLDEALYEAGAQHVLKFSFKIEDDQRSTHHLIFVTRHRKGYEVMKHIMASESSWESENGPSMTFVQRLGTGSLFDRDPLDVLGDQLLLRLKQGPLSLDELYEAYGPETSFTQPYFKRALLRLETQGFISAEPRIQERPAPGGKPTMAGNTVLTFEKEKL